MEIDFLSTLNDSNSVKNEETGETILTLPKYEIENLFSIKSSCKIISNCDSVISCKNFIIKSDEVFLKNIKFEASLEIINSNYVHISNCIFKNFKSKHTINIINSKFVIFNAISITSLNSIQGVNIKKDSKVEAKNISISESMNDLITVSCNSTLQLYDSHIFKSKSKGISVLEQSQLEIKNCILDDINFPAIYINNSKGIIENNEIKNILRNGIVLDEADSFEIGYNFFSKIKGSAMSVINDSTGDIHHNILSNIDCNGIYINSYSDVKVYQNEINQTKYPAIAILMKSKAKIYENKIAKINSCGIRCIETKKVEIENNFLNNIDECGITISDTEKCIINKNIISECKIAAIEVCNKSNAKVFDNQISNIEEYAFLVYTSAYINAENNDILNIGKSMTNLIYKGGGQFINNRITNSVNQMKGQTSFQYFYKGNGDFPNVTNDETKIDDTIIFEEKIIENNALCINCKENSRNSCLLNCGHDVYCQKCAEEALKNHEKCPLCRFPILQIINYPQKAEECCAICIENKPDCVLMPCGHIAFCHKCLEKWIHEKKSCPYCRKELVSFRIINEL